MSWAVIFWLILVKESLAVIYKLNVTEYNRMPPLYELDDYDRCLLAPEGTFCILDVALRGNNSLMQMIKGYSEHTIKHFNHSKIHRGVCVTDTCKGFIQNRTLEREEDLNVILEECLNESLWRNYELEGKVEKIDYCKKANEETIIDLSDIIVAVVYLVIILLNIVGSFYDILLCDINEKLGNPYLLAFSLRRNWKKLTAPSEGPDPRINRLKLFNGLRTMTIGCVFFSHAALITSYSFVDNPLYLESSYDDLSKQILFNGQLVTYTFFVMSAFLLAYNFEIHAEKHSVSWMQFPKGVLLRWLRLTPSYALILATISTWIRHAGSGPLWDTVVVSESNACRQYWWANLLYINNYIYEDAYCTPQTWYLASDTQLFCLGLLICILARTPRAKKTALLILFVLSIIVPALHTYFQDLDAVVIQSPETYRSLYAHDRTFRLLYARGHTNLSTYTIGLTGGFLTYYWQKEGKDFSKYKNYRVFHWLLFPLSVIVILSGGLFYVDGAPASTALRVLYAAIYKPVFQLLVLAFIVGCIFKIESVYRGIVEWRGFTWTGRVTYCGFLTHTIFQRAVVGAQKRPLHITEYDMMIVVAATTLLAFISAALLWLFVEAPCNNVTKAALSPHNRDKDTDTVDTTKV